MCTLPKSLLKEISVVQEKPYYFTIHVMVLKFIILILSFSYANVGCNKCLLNLSESRTVGVNPKINNMNQGYKAAKYKLLWICDSAIQGILATV